MGCAKWAVHVAKLALYASIHYTPCWTSKDSRSAYHQRERDRHHIGHAIRGRSTKAASSCYFLHGSRLGERLLPVVDLTNPLNDPRCAAITASPPVTVNQPSAPSRPRHHGQCVSNRHPIHAYTSLLAPPAPGSSGSSTMHSFPSTDQRRRRADPVINSIR